MRTKQGRPPPYASRKRKRASAKTPAVAAEVRATGDQGPPLGTGEDGADRISQIPDAILGEIVSLLPTKEGARTQVLAKRWRHIWRSAPLNLDCGGLSLPVNTDCGGKPTETSDLDRVVSHILTCHKAPVRRFCIPMDHGCREATLEAWFRSPTLDNLQELEFGYVLDYGRAWATYMLLLPPVPTFRFAATLGLINIGKCHLPDNTVQGLQFPQLKHLALHWVRISECSIHRLIDECPSLQCLLICHTSGFHCLRISSLTLRSIGVCIYPNYWTSESHLDRLVIKNAPCLERFLRFELLDGLQVSVISAPKLETLGIVNSDHPNYRPWVIQRLRADSLTTVARLVKTLAIHMDVLDLDVVIDLIRCFPCLEKLYIQDENVLKSGPKNLWRRKHRKLNGCLDIHLKTIVLETYKGSVSDVNFATFFVLKARELELMIIKVAKIDEQFIARQQRLLQLENKASRSARFQFTTDRCLRDLSDVCHARDLHLTDPFRYRC